MATANSKQYCVVVVSTLGRERTDPKHLVGKPEGFRFKRERPIPFMRKADFLADPAAALKAWIAALSKVDQTHTVDGVYIGADGTEKAVNVKLPDSVTASGTKTPVTLESIYDTLFAGFKLDHQGPMNVALATAYGLPKESRSKSTAAGGRDLNADNIG